MYKQGDRINLVCSKWICFSWLEGQIKGLNVDFYLLDLEKFMITFLKQKEVIVGLLVLLFLKMDFNKLVSLIPLRLMMVVLMLIIYLTR